MKKRDKQKEKKRHKSGFWVWIIFWTMLTSLLIINLASDLLNFNELYHQIGSVIAILALIGIFIGAFRIKNPRAKKSIILGTIIILSGELIEFIIELTEIGVGMKDHFVLTLAIIVIGAFVAMPGYKEAGK